MPRPGLREDFASLVGASHVYKVGTAHSTAAEVIAAAGSGKKIRIKAFRVNMAHALADGTAVVINNAWLADGTTAFLGLATQPAVDMAANTTQHHYFSSGMVTLPGYGLAGTANTALNIDFTTTDANLHYQLDLWYDVINATGDVQ